MCRRSFLLEGIWQSIKMGMYPWMKLFYQNIIQVYITVYFDSLVNESKVTLVIRSHCSRNHQCFRLTASSNNSTFFLDSRGVCSNNSIILRLKTGSVVNSFSSEKMICLREFDRNRLRSSRHFESRFFFSPTVSACAFCI